MEGYRLDCEFCEATIRTEGVDALKTEAKAHLTSDHYDDVLTALGEKYDEIDCHNDCGRALSVEADGGSGLDCPRCGFDNVSPLVGQYVYWQIERE